MIYNYMSPPIQFHHSVYKYSNETYISCIVFSLLEKIFFSFKFDFMLNLEKRHFHLCFPPERKCPNVSYLWTFLDSCLWQIYENLTIVVFNSPSQRWRIKWVDRTKWSTTILSRINCRKLTVFVLPLRKPSPVPSLQGIKKVKFHLSAHSLSQGVGTVCHYHSVRNFNFNL